MKLPLTILQLFGRQQLLKRILPKISQKVRFYGLEVENEEQRVKREFLEVLLRDEAAFRENRVFLHLFLGDLRWVIVLALWLGRYCFLGEVLEALFEHLEEGRELVVFDLGVRAVRGVPLAWAAAGPAFGCSPLVFKC